VLLFDQGYVVFGSFKDWFIGETAIFKYRKETSKGGGHTVS
jgi:hypothetical protein